MKFDRDQTFHYRTTFLLFSAMLYDVVLVWPTHATLLYSVVLCFTRACAAEVIFPLHSFVDFVFKDMFNRVVRNVAFVWPSLS